MRNKPAAALSANLVAVKGAAEPVSGMPGRTAIAPAPQPQPPQPEAEQAGGQPLNFRVPDTFRREFKVYAAQHGLKLNELLRLSFEAYRSQNNK